MEWAWKKLSSRPLEISELESLKEIVESYSFSDGSDFWKSKHSADGSFYVHNFRSLIDSKVTNPMCNPTKWIRLVPLKVTFSFGLLALTVFPLLVRFLEGVLGSHPPPVNFAFQTLMRLTIFSSGVPSPNSFWVGSSTSATCPFSNSIQLEGSSYMRHLGGIALKT